MNAMQGFRNRRKSAAAQHLWADPLRQLRQLLQRLDHRAADRADGQAFGQRIDGVDAGKFCEALFVHHAVGMNDLQRAVEDLRSA